jgi:ketosteroid isomerase-like protein
MKMKSSTAMFLFLVLTSACAVVRPPETNSASSATQSVDLERLSTEWTSAALRHDRARLEELMAPDYVLHTPDPKHPETPRAEWLDNLFNNLKIDHWVQTNISAHVYGDIGVVTAGYAWNGTFHEKAFDSTGSCTDVWRSHEKHWQVVSRTCVAFPGSVTLGGPAK